MAQARFHKISTAEDPDAFYIKENARDVRLQLRPLSTERTGWRAVLKRKWVSPSGIKFQISFVFQF
jgi:hypothetical protein